MRERWFSEYGNCSGLDAPEYISGFKSRYERLKRSIKRKRGCVRAEKTESVDICARPGATWSASCPSNKPIADFRKEWGSAPQGSDGATYFMMKTLPKVATKMALHILAYPRAMNIVGATCIRRH
jgi:hypothetical protein